MLYYTGMSEKKFLIYIFSFLGGVFFHSLFLSAHLSQNLLIFILMLVFILFFSGKEFLRVSAYALIIFFLGSLRFDLALHPEQKHALDSFVQEKIEIPLEGEIVGRPVRERGQQSFPIELHALVLGNHREPIQTSMQVKTYDVQEFQYGQVVQFRVVPQIPGRFETEGGRTFDYEHFLEKDGIYYIGKPQQLRILQEPKKNILSSLYTFKDKLLKHINRYIPKPESSLLAGVLLGEKTALSDELEEDFRTTGLMHIVVLSGYNVSLVIIAVMFLLAFLPLYTRSFIAVLSIVAFALLVGAGPTVIRASLMALFVVLAKVVGKPYYIERALLLAGAFMVLYNPWVLFFDISFQFSFLATFGLIALMPLFEKWLSFVPHFLAFRESAAATLSAQVMVMPLILYYIGDFSVISLVVNMLVLFMVPVTMLLGFVTAVFGFISSTLAGMVAIPTTLSLAYILHIVQFFAHIPFAKFFVQKFSFVWIILYYVLLARFLSCKQEKDLEEV